MTGKPGKLCLKCKDSIKYVIVLKCAVFIILPLLFCMFSAAGCVTLKPGFLGDQLKKFEKSIDKVAEISLR